MGIKEQESGSEMSDSDNEKKEEDGEEGDK